MFPLPASDDGLKFYCADAVGFQLSLPLKTVSTVIFSASSFVSCFVHFTRLSGFAPGPVLLYSAKRAVNSFVGLRQLFQPAGLM